MTARPQETICHRPSGRTHSEHSLPSRHRQSPAAGAQRQPPRKPHDLLGRYQRLGDALRDRRLTKSNIVVLYTIFEHINRETGTAFLSLTTIAKKSFCDRTTAVRGVTKLVKLRFIYRQSGNKTKANVYGFCERVGMTASRRAGAPSGNRYREVGAQDGACVDAASSPLLFKSNSLIKPKHVQLEKSGQEKCGLPVQSDSTRTVSTPYQARRRPRDEPEFGRMLKEVCKAAGVDIEGKSSDANAMALAKLISL